MGWSQMQQLQNLQHLASLRSLGTLTKTLRAVSTSAYHKMGGAFLTLLTYMYVLKIQAERAVGVLKSKLPPTVLEVFYVDPQLRLALPLYAPSVISSWSWHHWRHGKRDFGHMPSAEGAYVFRVWNQDTLTRECYMLTAAHLLEALQCKNLSAIWAYSDVGIVSQLHKYMEYKCQLKMSAHSIVDICVDSKPALALLKPYLSSLMLPHNICARTLAIWVAFLRWEKRITHEVGYPADAIAHVCLTNEDFEEKEFRDFEYLVQRKKDE